jgi:hypothetical protein
LLNKALHYENSGSFLSTRTSLLEAHGSLESPYVTVWIPWEADSETEENGEEDFDQGFFWGLLPKQRKKDGRKGLRENFTHDACMEVDKCHRSGFLLLQSSLSNLPLLQCNLNKALTEPIKRSKADPSLWSCPEYEVKDQAPLSLCHQSLDVDFPLNRA